MLGRGSSTPFNQQLLRLCSPGKSPGIEAGSRRFESCQTHVDIAQLVEHWIVVPGVAGSTPIIHLGSCCLENDGRGASPNNCPIFNTGLLSHSAVCIRCEAYLARIKNVSLGTPSPNRGCPSVRQGACTSVAFSKGLFVLVFGLFTRNINKHA